MSPIQFYFDFVSPYSYLAYKQLQPVAAAVDRPVDLKPIDVIALMARVGNRPTTVECAAKGRYAFTDLGRWAVRLNVPFAPNPHFRRIDKTPLLLGAIAAERAGHGSAYANAVFEGVWARGAAFENPAVTIALLRAGGVVDAHDIMATGATLADALEANITEAEAKGIFGTPSVIVDGQLYFGNDRMTFVEAALAA